MSLAAFTFWIVLLVLWHTFIGYTLLIAVLGWLRDEPPLQPIMTETPDVTVVVSVHNESSRISTRLQNIFSADYPADKLHVIVVSDGSTDDTVAQLESIAHPRVSLIIQPHRQGKAAALNLAVKHATSELIVFTDIRQRFAPDAIRLLVRHFSSLETGAVSGELVIEKAASTAGSGVDFYWKLEKFVRRNESRWDSTIGCTGAIYAIRRNLFSPLPPDTILDDVVIPMQIAMQKYRVRFEPKAIAYDPQTLEPAREQIRKRRTLAGNYQMLFRYPVWLLPWRSRLWWHLLSHKYLRLVAPFLLVALFVSNTVIVGKNIYGLFLLGQTLFYLLAFSGLRYHRFKTRFLSLPAGFLFLNWQAVVALWQYLRNPKSATWQMTAK